MLQPGVLVIAMTRVTLFPSVPPPRPVPFVYLFLRRWVSFDMVQMP